MSEPIPYGAQPGWWGQETQEWGTRCDECLADLENEDHVWWCGTFPDGCSDPRRD